MSDIESGDSYEEHSDVDEMSDIDIMSDITGSIDGTGDSGSELDSTHNEFTDESDNDGSDSDTESQSKTPVKRKRASKPGKPEYIHPWDHHAAGWATRLEQLNWDIPDGLSIFEQLNFVLNCHVDEDIRVLEDFRSRIKTEWDQYVEHTSQKLQVEDSDEICPKCKSKKTLSVFMQTRSADEPTSVFMSCVECRNRWRAA